MKTNKEYPTENMLPTPETIFNLKSIKPIVDRYRDDMAGGAYQFYGISLANGDDELVCIKIVLWDYSWNVIAKPMLLVTQLMMDEICGMDISYIVYENT